MRSGSKDRKGKGRFDSLSAKILLITSIPLLVVSSYIFIVNSNA